MYVILTHTHVFSLTQDPSYLPLPLSFTGQTRTYGRKQHSHRYVRPTVAHPQPRPPTIATLDFHHRRCSESHPRCRFPETLWTAGRHEATPAVTHFHIQGILSTDSSPSPSICPKHTNDPYHSLLSEFPALTQVCSPDSPIMHDVTHHIETPPPPPPPPSLSPSQTRTSPCSKARVRAHATAGDHTSFIQCMVLPPPHGAEEDCW